jgi:lipopolysaccharide biosynthesis protein
MKIAVCIHLYHGKMWDEIVSYLRNLKVDYDLYVNLPIKNEFKGNVIPVDFNWVEYLDLNPDLRPGKVKTEHLATRHYLRFGMKENRKYGYDIPILEKIKTFNPNTVIINSPNKGVDIGGFLYTYKHIDPNTDLILKIHTKTGLGDPNKPSRTLISNGKSKAVALGHSWFQTLMNGVLKNENQVKKIIEEFEKNSSCGMVGGKINNNFSLNANEMERLYRIIKLENKYDGCHFVGGTVFWVRNSILKKYLTPTNIVNILEILPPGYVHEPSPNHAMERIFGCMVYNENQELKLIK